MQNGSPGKGMELERLIEQTQREQASEVAQVRSELGERVAAAEARAAAAERRLTTLREALEKAR
jgi:hypothetical protein